MDLSVEAVKRLADAMTERIQGEVSKAVAEEFRKRSADSEQQGTSGKRPKVDFKHVGNRKQSEFNGTLLESVENAIRSVTSGDVEKTAEYLEQGKKLILKREKLIRLADREDDRWSMVKFYESDDHASDSEDEKSIARARRLAATDRKKRAKKRKKTTRFHSSPKRDVQSTPESPTSTSVVKYEREKSERKGVICFTCGKEGHMKYLCPLQYKKWNK